MNKELIKRYKKEFDHWLNGGNVQVYYKKDDEPKWWTDKESINYGGDDNFSNIIDKSLSPDYVLVVIDDEYVEFRKALAEGKTIQCNAKEGENDITYTAYGDTWWVDTIEFKYATRFYRIKPEEPKFKVGDWLIEIHSGSYAKVLEVFTQEVRVKLYDCNSIITTENTDFKLWKPQLGELVILKNKNDITSIIKYNGETNVYPFIGEITWLHKKD